MTSKAYFDTVAPQWDEIRAEFYPETVRERAYAEAGLREGMAVADVGAGTGYISDGLAGRGLRIVAVDQSAGMLSVMREKLAGREDIEYRQGVAERLPLPDGEVERVFSNMYLHHVEDPPASIAEMARALKPGGRMVLVDLVAHEYAFLAEEHHDRWMGFDMEEVRGWFEAAGLSGVKVELVGED